jgi:two-component system, OmpR family, phosphate regulon sensor histidine kinase PhoR
MKRRKLIPDPVLMMVSILAIAAFQLYWLKENYDREKKTLTIKSEVTFRETIRHLQVAKLKLGGLSFDSLHSGKRTMIMKEENGVVVKMRDAPQDEVITTMNVIRDKIMDSSRNGSGVKGNMVITMNTKGLSDAEGNFKFDRSMPGPGGDHFIELLYGVDSLQDSLRINEIKAAYDTAMQKQELDVPFTVLKLDSADVSEEPIFNEVTVGFAKPVTYKMELGNTFPYLMKRIIQPILFSILLLGITILAFVLLYRNLLRQRRLADAKNEFISNITHELKTPIATVGVAIEALKNFNAIHNPERTKEYLDISSNELQRLNLLVDKVLKLSMFETKDVELKQELFNLQDVVTEVVDSLRLQLEKNHATVSITHEGDTSLHGDRLHLLSVVFNLLDNAIKYSNENPAIAVDLKGSETSVVLTISDNGIGIAPEYKDKIFEKFFRVPHGDTHDAKGYGLGLSYVAQVIKKHNGTIEMESQSGKGTSFTITLPKQTA